MTDFIEMRIMCAVRKLLAGRVNELLAEMEFAVPSVEFGEYAGNGVVVPALALSSCERTEKERVLHIDAYNLTLVFSVSESPESELYCYAYAAAVERALGEDATLGGVANRAVLTGKKYQPPKKAGCGLEWEIALTLRVTVEGMGNGRKVTGSSEQ